MVDDSAQQKEPCQRNARRTLARISPLSPRLASPRLAAFKKGTSDLFSAHRIGSDRSLFFFFFLFPSKQNLTIRQETLRVEEDRTDLSRRVDTKQG